MKRLVLAGGGHAHVEVLRRFGEEPEDDAEVVLVSPEAGTPYSGMLPGLVAGHYTWDQCHIDLDVLAAFARARFYRTRVTDIAADERQVTLADGSRLGYDVLSVDTGSTPPLDAISGADTVGTAVKPVSGFLDAWRALLARPPSGTPRIVVVGGGAGGVEIALAMDHRWRTERARKPAMEILAAGDTLLPGHARRVVSRLTRALDSRGIGWRTGCAADSATASGVRLADGSEVPADWLVWATGARPASWLRASGLALDERGFVSVDTCLRSVSHEEVFGAGDVISIQGHPRPRSGVFAVRQGPPLAENLRRTLRGAPLVRHVPQRVALSLISTGDRHAIASWRGLALEGDWVWRWKDWIDRRFMARYAVSGTR